MKFKKNDPRKLRDIKQSVYDIATLVFSVAIISLQSGSGITCNIRPH